MMSQIGTFALYLALYVCVVGVALSVAAGRTGARRFVVASRFAAYTAAGAIATASSVLMHALLTHDFSIQYVQSFSSRSMPLFYLIGAFWGGQAGSLLFWTSTVSASMAAALWLNRRSYQDFMPWVTATCLLVLTGLLLILCLGSNPFEPYHVLNDPTTGKGLNPLLQTPKMVMHPPSLLAGLATMTIPFSFAIAALITGNFSNSWVTAARKWILIPWFFLSVGNMLGGMWAYEELGWGGYWAWDPVENAAFFPWLMASALIHSIMIQERRGMLKRWNIGLMIASFTLTLFGTYITRSGLIQSVHTFAQSDIGDYFLALLLTVITLSVGLFAWRWKDMSSDQQRFDSVASRESAFLFNNWLLVIMTVVVLFGTMWPKVKEGIWGQEVSIGPPWFNRWMVPLGLLLVLLMAIGTIIPWRKTTLKSFMAQFGKPLVATALAAPTIIAAYWFGRGVHLGVSPDPLELVYAVLCVVFVVFATASMVAEVWRAIDARKRAHEESASAAMMTLLTRQNRRYGGYVVHLGILCAFVAFAGNALKMEQDVSLALGETVQVGDYALTYRGLEEKREEGRTLLIAKMDVTRRGEAQLPMHPGKAIFDSNPQMPTSEIDIRSTPLEDLYVAFVSAGPNAAAFKVFVAPLTWWFWLGGTILIFGTMICLWPRQEELDRLGLTFGEVVRALVALLVMGALSSMPLVAWTVESNSGWGSALRYRVVTTERVDAAANTDVEAPASTPARVREAS